MTPEGKVKDQMRKVFKEHFIFPASKAIDFPAEAKGWYYFPSQNGFGVSGIPDIIGVYKGFAFGIELKAPGRRGEKNRGCSPHQYAQLLAIKQVGGYAAVVDGGEDINTFIRWLLEK